MSSKPETLFRKRVSKDLTTLPNAWFESIQQRGIRGTPDIIGCLAGLFVALELKSQSGKPSELQDHKIRLIQKAKGIALIVYPDEWTEAFRSLKHIAECRTKMMTKENACLN